MTLMIIEFAVIVVAAGTTGAAYHTLLLGVHGMARPYYEIGAVVASVFAIASLIRADYEVGEFFAFTGQASRLFAAWNAAFLTLFVAFFTLKSSQELSRAAILLLYFIGYSMLWTIRCCAIFWSRRAMSAGLISVSRAVLVGDESDLRNFKTKYQPETIGLDIVASFVMRDRVTLIEDFALVAAASRVLRPDDIFILASLEDTVLLETALGAFTPLPSAIHVGPEPLLARFPHAEIQRIGHLNSLLVVRRPLSLVDAAVKRAFDIFIAASLILLFSPLLAILTLLAKRNGSGIVINDQWCYGFNEKPFKLMGFSTEFHQKDGSAIKNVRRLVYLQHLKIDRLPELFNVLRGEMSLIGPKPQSVPLSQRQEKLTAAYPRRHNLKPGLIGWAQLHGLHESHVSDSILQERTDYDLYYVNNWTHALDAKILVRSLFRSVPLLFIPKKSLVTRQFAGAAGLALFHDHNIKRVRYKILGVNIDDMNKQSAVSLMSQFLLTSNERKTVFIANAHTLNVAAAYPNFRDVLNFAEYTFGDGVGVRLAARLYGRTPLDNLNGTDLIPALLEATNTAELKCYLLGGEVGTVAKAAEMVASKYKGWSIVGHHHGFLDRLSENKVLKEIEACRPDLLLVGMGNPFQECWIAENRDQLSAKLVVGVGALFSYLSGDYTRAPQAFRRAGLEWLFVLAVQRHKWRRYLFGVPAYILRVVVERVLVIGQAYEQNWRENGRRS